MDSQEKAGTKPGSPEGNIRIKTTKNSYQKLLEDEAAFQKKLAKKRKE